MRIDEWGLLLVDGLVWGSALTSGEVVTEESSERWVGEPWAGDEAEMAEAGESERGEEMARFVNEARAFEGE